MAPLDPLPRPGAWTRLWSLATGRWGALLWAFGWRQARCCIFAFSVVGLLALSQLLPLQNWGVARYDALLLGCLLVQFGLVLARWESLREVCVILAFHGLGFALEVFKVHQGSWSYPEEAWTRFWGVPLYAGFMYASVGSYMAQAWREFGLHLSGLPPLWVQAALAGAVYLNFFTHHYGPDLRWVLSVLLLLAYARTRVSFQIRPFLWQRDPAPLTVVWPLPLAFGLIGLAVYVAENAATLLGAWVYPHQNGGWQPVHLGKWLAWTLMVVVAFLIVSGLKGWEKQLSTRRPPRRRPDL